MQCAVSAAHNKNSPSSHADYSLEACQQGPRRDQDCRLRVHIMRVGRLRPHQTTSKSTGHAGVSLRRGCVDIWNSAAPLPSSAWYGAKGMSGVPRHWAIVHLRPNIGRCFQRILCFDPMDRGTGCHMPFPQHAILQAYIVSAFQIAPSLGRNAIVTYFIIGLSRDN